jgi:hypothetical protein
LPVTLRQGAEATGLSQAAANAEATTIPLTALRLRRPNAVTALPAGEFTISGKLDLADDPDFLSAGGTISLYIDWTQVRYR